MAKNRSEVVRDLVRDALVEDECSMPGRIVMGTLTIVYSHHANDLQEKLHHIQHTYLDMVVASMHVHVDEENCLEVIILKGETGGQPHHRHQGRENRQVEHDHHGRVHLSALRVRESQ